MPERYGAWFRPAAAGTRPARGASPAPDTAGLAARQRAGTASHALNNLRAFVILIVLGFHSALAYLGSLGPAPFAFAAPPYMWRAFPIIDRHRWFGFDIFCAWQDVYLMALMFFLSALFTWPSLARKGTGRFLRDRWLRLGVPFAFALIIVMPIALYPTYAVTAASPSLLGYVRAYAALPFWPDGPMWFLWQLLALTLLAAALHRWAPDLVSRLARWSSAGAAHPGRAFLGLAAAAVLAYVPLALAFTPWTWSGRGPFALQFSRPLLYAAFYLAGLGIGADGIERGLLATSGRLARRWAAWLAAALAAFVLWMRLTALAMNLPAPPALLQIAVDVAFALACASGCFAVLAACLRFATARSPLLDGLASSAFGIYVVHYVFVVWLQDALLGAPFPAIVKMPLVFAGTLALAWAATIGLGVMPLGWRLIGAPRRLNLRAPSPRAVRHLLVAGGLPPAAP